MIAILPLNLMFYVFVTALGLYFMIKSKYLGKIVSVFLFAFLTIWVSNDNILNVFTWTIYGFDNATSSYAYNFTTTAISTPFNDIFVWLNLILSFMAILAIYSEALETRRKKDELD